MKGSSQTQIYFRFRLIKTIAENLITKIANSFLKPHGFFLSFCIQPWFQQIKKMEKPIVQKLRIFLLLSDLVTKLNQIRMHCDPNVVCSLKFLFLETDSVFFPPAYWAQGRRRVYNVTYFFYLLLLNLLNDLFNVASLVKAVRATKSFEVGNEAET